MWKLIVVLVEVIFKSKNDKKIGYTKIKFFLYILLSYLAIFKLLALLIFSIDPSNNIWHLKARYLSILNLYISINILLIQNSTNPFLFMILVLC